MKLERESITRIPCWFSGCFERNSIRVSFLWEFPTTPQCQIGRGGVFRQRGFRARSPASMCA